MIFDKESDFEEAVIGVLIERGWEPEVIRHPSEADLLKTGRIFCSTIIGREIA